MTENSLIEENKKLILELNKLMDTESELPGFANDNKIIPYLGWYWRSIEIFEAKGITVSLYNGLWWIDETGKWDCPKKRLTTEDTNKALKLWISIVKTRIEYCDLSKSWNAEAN